jgi:glycosyltransferase involved in cell wall biosynthesis
MNQTIPVSAYIITLNEAANIGACLERLKHFDEVIVVDSGSSDATVEIASAYVNVKTSFNAWPGFSQQKAHALSLCSNKWVLNVDADEIVTEEFLAEARRVIAADEVDALESNRTLYRWGSRPKHFGGDDRLIRLFKKAAGHYEVRRVHESISITGKIAKTDATIEHYENLSYSQRIDKANKYSQARAEDKFEKGHTVSVVTLILIFPLTFIQIYFLKGHFLDGVDGLLTAMNAAFYAFMKYAKLWELNKKRGSVTTPSSKPG